MKQYPWRPLIITCVVQAVATTLSPSAGIFVGVCVGVYLAARLWFVNHPATWWYDLFFWITVLSIAVLATVLRAGICAVLPLTGYTMRSCGSLDLPNAAWLHLATIVGVAVIFWCYGRVKLWWASRDR